jgi:hypothetical protein
MSDQRDTLGLVDKRRVSRIRRIRYEVRGTVKSINGPVELSFADGGVVLLEPASDGERLVVRSTAWVDPFSPPLTSGNDEFVRTHGKWTAVDVSDQEPYGAIVGREASLVRPILNPALQTIGLAAVFPNAELRAEVVADELVVDVALVSSGDPEL